MQEEIYKLAAQIAGASPAETTLLTALCTAAEALWRGRLRKGVAPEDCKEVFCCAAALSAAADLAASRSSGGAVFFRAGQISVRESSTGQTGQPLRQSAERIMEPYAAPEGFAFRGVRG